MEIIYLLAHNAIIMQIHLNILYIIYQKKIIIIIMEMVIVEMILL